MKIRLANPSRPQGEWKEIQIGQNLIGTRIDAIQIEAHEFDQVMDQSIWLRSLSRCFPPSKLEQPVITKQREEIPDDYDFDDSSKN